MPPNYHLVTSETCSPQPSHKVFAVEFFQMPYCFHSCAGVPLPTLQWFKDATAIGKLQGPRYEMLSSGGLRIQKLRPEDSGVFQCFASNEGGEIQTYTYLDVTSESCPTAARPPALSPQPELPTRKTVASVLQTDKMWEPAVTHCGGPPLRPTKAHMLSPQAANMPHCPYALPPDLHSGEPRALLSAEK